MDNKDNILAKISYNIRIERFKKRMTQEILAEKVGVSTKYINLIENKRVNPSIVVIVNICNALEIDMDTLIRDIK